MQLVFDDKKKRQIKNQEKIKFSSFSSYHLIVISARAKSEKQLGKEVSDDEDLTIQIDDRSFPKLNSNRLKDSPAAFSGGRLHNLSKTIYYLTFLKGKNHTITLETDEEPNTATFETLQVYILNPTSKLALEPKIQAEDGDRRPWLTFVLDNLPLQEINATITYSRRRQDSDDVKIKTDGKTQDNIVRNIKHFLWRFVGSFLPWSSPTKTETQRFDINLPEGLHYVEFDADRMPILHKIAFDFGIQPPIPKGVPTVDSPKWTGDFYDDTTEILLARLIFGETESQSKEAKIGVGFTVINRVKKQKSNWGLTIREVILKENQYDAMWNPDRRDKVRDPLKEVTPATKAAWEESYKIATGILDESLKDPTLGATNFHSFQNPDDFPSWATKKTYKTKLGDIYFYELEK
jgi:hypothetical protein